ncbi:MAG: YceD family protein, partial [Ilumatobacteraceae bacterium]
MASPLIVNIAELLRRPGTKRDISLVLPASLFGFDDVRIADDSSIDVKLLLESLTDGIVVRGELGGHWQLQCRRCLRPVTDASVANVDELYQRIPDNPDAYPLVGEQLDLQP